MIVTRFNPEHLRALLLQPAQSYAQSSLGDPQKAAQLAAADSWAAIEDGRVVAVAGVSEIWTGRGDAWALIAADIGPRLMTKVHYATKRFLEANTLRRIEAACVADFHQGHRWLEALGFSFEGPLAKYAPDGSDCVRYARVR